MIGLGVHPGQPAAVHRQRDACDPGAIIRGKEHTGSTDLFRFARAFQGGPLPQLLDLLLCKVVKHGGLHQPGAHGVHRDAVRSQFEGAVTGQVHDGRFGRGVSRTTTSGKGGTILDEPVASLSVRETRKVFETMERVKNQGMGSCTSTTI